MANCLKRLLGQCCCGCCPPQGWEERRVIGLAGRTALTSQGPVRLRPGHHPRPGQTIVVTGGAETSAGCAPPPSSGVSVGASRQARSQIRPSDEDVLAVPAPELDGWTRPVLIGFGTLTVPSADGPLLLGDLPEPAQAYAGTDLLSHVQGGRLFRDPEWLPSFTAEMTPTDLPVFPFSAIQRHLDGEFPTEGTTTDTEGNVYSTGPLPEPLPRESSVLWRIRQEGPSVPGTYSGTETYTPWGERAQTRPLSAPGAAAPLELATRIWMRLWGVGPYGPSTPDIGLGMYADDPACELVWLPIRVMSPDGQERVVPLPYLHWYLPADAEDRVFEHYLAYSPGNTETGRGYETLWRGELARGNRPGLQLVRPEDSPDPAEEPEPGGQTHWPLTRLLWDGWGWSRLPDPDPYDHSYDAAVPSGLIEQRAPKGSVSTGSHRDHLQDGATLTLAGTTLPCTSWAVLARREGNGPDAAGTPGLITCDGTTLRAYWRTTPTPAEVDVTRLLGLRDAQGDPLPAGTVTDALLESELDLPRFPDHVRLLYTLAGERRAAILAPWNPWRDLDKAGWAKVGKARPRTLKAFLSLARSRWPPTPAHGLAYQGPITPPTLDEAGLPRYGASVAYLLGPEPYGVRWPWLDRDALDDPDDRAGLKLRTLGASLETSWAGGGPAVVVGRAKGERALKRTGGHWAFTTATGRAGLRPFVIPLPAPPATLTAPSLHLEHLALHRLPQGGGDT